MLATKIDVTHSIGGVRVASRPRAAVRRGQPVVIVDLVDASTKVYPKGADVAVGGYTEPFPAGTVKSLIGTAKIDYAERQAGFAVSRKPR